MLSWDRRAFIKTTALGTASIVIIPSCNAKQKEMDRTEDQSGENARGNDRFKISLAQWSLNKSIFGGHLDHLDFAKKASELGIFGVEYVNQFFKDKATDTAFLNEMNQRASGHGVTQLLIMIDGEGGLAELDDVIRNQAVTNHHKWIEAAKVLGCHSIRVNAFGNSMDRTALHAAAVDRFGSLSSFAQKVGVNVIVENHGGLSSDGQWLSGVIKEVNMSNCGTLPDFGNFCIEREGGAQWGARCIKEYDKYTGVEELMRYAKGVSAKSYDFDGNGNETTIDFEKMIEIVKESSYSGYIGIEYEGTRLSEEEGILATKKMLERLLAD